MTLAPIRMDAVRIDVRRGVRALLLTLVIPVSLALAVDLAAGSLPWLTVVASLICLPLAAIVVNRTVLAEFDRVVALLAPPQEVVAEPEKPAEIEMQEGVEGQAAAELTGQPARGAGDFIPTDRPLGGPSFTEGAQ